MSEMNGGDGAVVFDITAKTTGFENALQTITQTLNGAANNWDLVIDAFDIKMGLRISNAINDAVNEGIDLASNLEEIANRINVAFGEEGAREIDEWSKTVHDKFGISELQAKNYVSLLGAQFSATGMDKETAIDYAIRVAERVGDIASLYDAGFDTVFRKARSGISGIARPLYDYGVDLTKSTVENAYQLKHSSNDKWDQLTESEQEIARMDELFRQTDYLVGDFERTQDSYANLGRRSENAWEAFLTKVGQFLLPFKTNQRKVATGLLESLAYGPTAERLLGPLDSTVSSNTSNRWLLNLFGASTDSLLESASKNAFEKKKSDMLDSFWMLAEEGSTGTLETVANAFLSEMKKQIDKGIEQGANMGKYERIANTYENENLSEYSADELYSTLQYLTDVLSQIYEITGTDKENQIFNSLYTAIDQYTKSISEGANSIDDAGYSAASSIRSAGSNITSALNSVAASLNPIKSAPFSLVFSKTYKKAGSSYNGLDYVPYDGYLALLHQGERVQTAAEASLSRRYSLGSPQSFDYGAMGNAIGAHLPQGNMQIIWRGRVVADILSKQQANSYRSIERSRWQG